mgnify:CR=1 FL=1
MSGYIRISSSSHVLGRMDKPDVDKSNILLLEKYLYLYFQVLLKILVLGLKHILKMPKVLVLGLKIGRAHD